METGAESEHKVNLKQTIGLGTGVALIVGGILGKCLVDRHEGITNVKQYAVILTCDAAMNWYFSLSQNWCFMSHSSAKVL